MSLPPFLFSSSGPATSRAGFTATAPANAKATDIVGEPGFHHAFAQATQSRSTSTASSTVPERAIADGVRASGELQEHLRGLIADLQKLAEEGSVGDDSPWAELLRDADLSVEKIDWLAANLQVTLDRLSVTGDLQEAASALRDLVGLLTGGKMLPADLVSSDVNLSDEVAVLATDPDQTPVTEGLPGSEKGSAVQGAAMFAIPLRNSITVDARSHSEAILNAKNPLNVQSALPVQNSFHAETFLSQDASVKAGDLLADGKSAVTTQSAMVFKSDVMASPLSALFSPENPAESVVSQAAVNPMNVKGNTATGLQAPTEASLHSAMKVQVAFGHAQWSSALAERTAWLASQQIHSAELQLDPPELGPLQVRISVNQDQAAVSFVSANPQVREALDQSMMRLRELLQEQGMQLVDAGVSDQQRGDDNQNTEADTHGPEGQLVGASAEDATEDLDLRHTAETRYGVDDFV